MALIARMNLNILIHAATLVVGFIFGALHRLLSEILNEPVQGTWFKWAWELIMLLLKVGN